MAEIAPTLPKPAEWKTALVVDDEAGLLQVYADFLDRIGYVATGVTNWDDARLEVERHTYDLALLDLRMPSMTGFEALRYLRANHPATAIIMVSGTASEAFAATAVNLGADAYVTKPCSLGYLAQRIREAEADRGPSRRVSGSPAPVAS